MKESQGTIACVMLSIIRLSLSRAEFRTISVSKCASHLAQLMCVVWVLVRFFLGGGGGNRHTDVECKFSFGLVLLLL